MNLDQLAADYQQTIAKLEQGENSAETIAKAQALIKNPYLQHPLKQTLQAKLNQLSST